MDVFQKTCKLSSSCLATCSDCRGTTDDTDPNNPVDNASCYSCIQGYYFKDSACVQHENCSQCQECYLKSTTDTAPVCGSCPKTANLTKAGTCLTC